MALCPPHTQNNCIIKIFIFVYFVFQADEAYYIGPAASQESYLNQKKIIEVAKYTGAQVLTYCCHLL